MSAVTRPDDEQLVDQIAGFFADPLGFVLFAFDWGVGTLKNETGPDTWQRDILTEIGRQVAAGMNAEDAVAESIRVAVASGKGIGKSALIAWIILWFMSTRPGCLIRVTANTLPQLSGTTWREVAKWHKLSINREWFKFTATRLYHIQNPETWFAAAMPWNEEKPENFAGQHDQYVMTIFDEGSGIADIIYEYAEGILTTPGAIFIVFGNPTRNTGRFRNIFASLRHRWTTRQIDSRKCKMADKRQINEWIEDYGEDSDFVRVTIKGEFPRAASRQFIPNDVVDMCIGNEFEKGRPKVVGVDVATGEGSDMSVICLREGRKITRLDKYRCDTMTLAAHVVEIFNAQKPDALFVDGIGVGTGLVDRLRQLNLPVVSVNAGVSADNAEKYRNKRSEMWGRMKDWLSDGADIPDDPDLKEDLTSIEFFPTDKQQIALERKKDMRGRGLRSPDCGDAVALGFAYPVALRDVKKAANDREIGHDQAWMA